MMSVELLLEPAADAEVRQQWHKLVDAGLPSQARHTGDSNAPHITLVAANRVSDAGLGSVLAWLPLEVTLGSWVVFGQPPKSLVLARLVVMSADLMVIHRAVHAMARDVDGLAMHSAPGDWTPHVTLASRLTPEGLAAALTALGNPTPITTTATSVRHWNGTTKIATVLNAGAPQ